MRSVPRKYQDCSIGLPIASCPRPNGTEIVISATAAAVREMVDEPAELVVTVWHDITDSEHLENLRNQFFAAAAHSLKTPVAIIKANAQVLSRGAAPQFRRSTAAIERQSDRIDRLVQNLLVLARARSQTLKLYPNKLELEPLVKQVVRELAEDSLQRDVHTKVVNSPRIYADQERLVRGRSELDP